MSGLERLRFANREEWLAGRMRGLGGSDAAAAAGLSPWKTPLTLWKEKTGAQAAPDLSGNAAIEKGKRMEPIIRDFFMGQHPEYTLYYGEFDVLYQSDMPWVFATLDGELTETATGRKGILEIKTATPNGANGWEQWKNQVPMHYYAQVLHALLATGYEFAVLYAALYDLRGGITFPEPYVFERKEHEEDIAWLLEREKAFWQHVEIGTPPPQILRI